MDYYPKDTYFAKEFGEGWRYSVIPEKHREELYHFLEDEIEPLSPQELQIQITAELEQYQRQIASLQQQLSEIHGGVVHGYIR